VNDFPATKGAEDGLCPTTIEHTAHGTRHMLTNNTYANKPEQWAASSAVYLVACSVALRVEETVARMVDELVGAMVV
jgi:hypothetical protein